MDNNHIVREYLANEPITDSLVVLSVKFYYLKLTKSVPTLAI